MIIVVVGMHRSGTSMVARGLAAMGINLGKQVDIEPHPSNPHGHWEHALVWPEQERLLMRLGREWHSSPGPLPPRWLEWPDTLEAIERLGAVARAELAGHGHWLVKDPRASLLLPLWRVVAQRLKTRLSILRVWRPAVEVALSLEARNGMPAELAQQIWSLHQQSIDRDAAGLPVYQAKYAQIMREPHSSFAAMGVFCGLADADAAARAAAAAALVDPGLWHCRATGSVEDAPGETPARTHVGSPTRGLGLALVVMRTRWRTHFLPRAVRSVLCQTYPDWFLQIVNDGGPPHLVESAVAPYRHLLEGRLNILHLDRQHGMEAAANAGIAAGPGDFIAIHDDDDRWSPEFLERMIGSLGATGQRAAVCKGRQVREAWNGSEYTAQEVIDIGPEREYLAARDLELENLFPPISLVFRRVAFDLVGRFHEGLPALGDWHFNKRLAALEPIGVVPERLAFHHVRPARDSAPNSPATDHSRAYHFVRSWPLETPPPAFFSQLRLVEMWDEGLLLGTPRHCPLPTEGVLSLAPGLYVLRIPVVPGGVWTLHCGKADRFVEAETLSLGPGRNGAAHVLLNAIQRSTDLGLSQCGGPIQAPPFGTEVAWIADPIPSLERLAASPRLPDVLCIGAQRSGTTWLHACLQASERVWGCGIKEFHQFDWDGVDPAVGTFRQRQALGILKMHERDSGDPSREGAVRMALRHAFPVAHGWENYAATFADAPASRLVLDFTPAYSTLAHEVVADIARVMPKAKVIFVLRDPVTRAVSGALHSLRQDGTANPTEAQLSEACMSAHNVLRTDYIRALGVWQRHFPADRLLILFHDEILGDPARVLARTLAFLGIDGQGGVLPPLSAVLNAGSGRLAWPALARVKASLSRAWLPMILDLEGRYGHPVSQWRLAAEARLRALEGAARGAGAGVDHSVLSNLAQWDAADGWEGEGDQWNGQALACSVPYEVWKREILNRYLPLFPPAATILEIGPGHGRWSEQLIERAGLLVLCDISPNCLDACRQRLTGRGRLRTHVSTFTDLPTDLAGTIDVVWSFDCFVHMHPEDCEQYLQEIARVLAPGGIAVIHHADCGVGGWLARAGFSMRSKRHRQAASSGNGWRSTTSRKNMARWAAGAGLLVQRQERSWHVASESGAIRVGVPRFGDCLSVLRRPSRPRGG